MPHAFKSLAIVGLALAILGAPRALAAGANPETPPSLTILAPPAVYPDSALDVKVDHETFYFTKVTVRCESLIQYKGSNPTVGTKPLTVYLNNLKVKVVYAPTWEDVLTDLGGNKTGGASPGPTPKGALPESAAAPLTPDTSAALPGPASTPGSEAGKRSAGPGSERAVFLMWNGPDLDLYLPWQGWAGWVSWGDYRGKVKVVLQCGDVVSYPGYVLISGVGWRYLPVSIAFIATLLIFLAIVLVLNPFGKKYKVANRSYNCVTAFLLDKETATYSLSKVQFYAWTATAMFGYVTLYVAQILIQGKADIPDIPSTLPGIIFVSGATMLTASGIGNVRGPKGAGDMYPSLADLVSTGGMVVPERFQFLSWTVVGIFSFLFLIIWSDPATLESLPQISTQFLALMGISSAGYLGGRIVRKPGPVIDEITAKTGSGLSLALKGQKLSKGAVFKIDDLDVKSPVLTFGEVDDTNTPPDFYKLLNVAVSDPAPVALTGGRHRLKIINPDGQEAEWYYDVPATPQIATAGGVLSGTDKATVLTVKVSGSELSENATFKIDGISVQPEQLTLTTGDSDEPGAAVPTLFKTLNLEIRNLKDTWKEGGHYLEVANPGDLKVQKPFQVVKG